jgi:3-mercaptopropionate dioxygenase
MLAFLPASNDRDLTPMSLAEQNSQPEPRVPAPAALKRFIWDIQSMVELTDSEREILLIGRDLMGRLLSGEDWLPAAFSAPSPGGGRQFQVYSDGMERFCVASTVLAGGAGLTVAQPAVWELMGVVSGAVSRGAGAGEGRLLRSGMVEALGSGRADSVSLSNPDADRPAITIHVYGGGISKLARHESGPDGDGGRTAHGWANGEGDPPYDIFSIQNEIKS